MFFVSPTIEGMGFEVYTESNVAKQHEFGGVVMDPSGGRLAVPLSARQEMFTRRGKLKTRFKRPGKLRGVKAMIFKGKTFLARLMKREKKILPLYVLKRFVRLKPRLGFYRTWESLADYKLRILDQAAGKALRKI